MFPPTPLHTPRDGKIIIKVVLIVIIALGILGYSGFQARHLIIGPQIALAAPLNGQTVDSPMITVHGQATNFAFLTLNGRQVPVDSNGMFDEQLLLEPGYNHWQMEIKDRFGRTVTKDIELVFKKS